MSARFLIRAVAAWSLTFVFPLVAQSSSPQSIVDSLRLTLDRAVEASDPVQLASAAALAERATLARPNDALLRHYYGYSLYRLAAVTLGREGSGKARPYAEKARDVLEPLAADTTDSARAETYALLSAVYGLQIATSRVIAVAGMRFGPKSTEWMDRAVAFAPNNPRVWLLRGIGAINTPSSFGGGLDKATLYLEKAIDLYSRDMPAEKLPRWGKAEAHAWLGQVHARKHQPELARTEYEAALAIEPNNAWVRLVLLPSLAKLD